MAKVVSIKPVLTLPPGGQKLMGPQWARDEVKDGAVNGVNGHNDSRFRLVPTNKVRIYSSLQSMATRINGRPVYADTPVILSDPHILDPHTFVLAKGDEEVWLRVVQDRGRAYLVVVEDPVIPDKKKPDKETRRFEHQQVRSLLSYLKGLSPLVISHLDIDDEDIDLLIRHGVAITAYYPTSREGLLHDPLGRDEAFLYVHGDTSVTRLECAHAPSGSLIVLSHAQPKTATPQDRVLTLPITNGRSLQINITPDGLNVSADFFKDKNGLSPNSGTLTHVDRHCVIINPDHKLKKGEKQQPLIVRYYESGPLAGKCVVMPCDEATFFKFLVLPESATEEAAATAAIIPSKTPKTLTARSDVTVLEAPVTLTDDEAWLTINCQGFEISLCLEVTAEELLKLTDTDHVDVSFSGPPRGTALIENKPITAHFIQPNGIYVRGTLFTITSVMRLDSVLVADVSARDYHAANANSLPALRADKAKEEPTNAIAPAVIRPTSLQPAPLFAARSGALTIPAAASRKLWLHSVGPGDARIFPVAITASAVRVAFNVTVAEDHIKPVEEAVTITVGKRTITAALETDPDCPHLFWLNTTTERYPLYQQDMFFYLGTRGYAKTETVSKDWLARHVDRAKQDKSVMFNYFGNVIYTARKGHTSNTAQPIVPKLTVNPFTTEAPFWQDMIFEDGEIIGLYLTQTEPATWQAQKLRLRATPEDGFLEFPLSDTVQTPGKIGHIRIGGPTDELHSGVLHLFFQDGAVTSLPPFSMIAKPGSTPREEFQKMSSHVIDNVVRVLIERALADSLTRHSTSHHTNHDETCAWADVNRAREAFFMARTTTGNFDCPVVIGETEINFKIHWDGIKKRHGISLDGGSVKIGRWQVKITLTKSPRDNDLYWLQLDKDFVPIVVGQSNVYIGLTPGPRDLPANQAAIASMRHHAGVDNQRASRFFANVCQNGSGFTLLPAINGTDPDNHEAIDFWQDVHYPDGSSLGVLLEPASDGGVVVFHVVRSLRYKPAGRDDFFEFNPPGALTIRENGIGAIQIGGLGGDNDFGFVLLVGFGLVFPITTRPLNDARNNNQKKLFELATKVFTYMAINKPRHLKGYRQFNPDPYSGDTPALLDPGDFLQAQFSELSTAVALSRAGTSPKNDGPPVWPVKLTSADGHISTEIGVYYESGGPGSESFGASSADLTIQTPTGRFTAKRLFDNEGGVIERGRYRYCLYLVDGHKPVFIYLSAGTLGLGSTNHVEIDLAELRKSRIPMVYMGRMRFPDKTEALALAADTTELSRLTNRAALVAEAPELATLSWSDYMRQLLNELGIVL